MVSLVSIVKGKRSVETVKKAIKLIGGVDDFTDKPVLIKVNFISTKTWETGATTDPIVVEALIQLFKQVNNEIYVGDSDATATSADEAAKATGILDLCHRYNVKFVNLRWADPKVIVKVNGEALKKIKIPKLVLDSYVISAAKMKTHTETIVTLGLKNMFGCLPNKLKSRFHLKGINKVIVDVNRVVSPALTVIDGFIAMEGKGPVSGDPIKMNLIVAGRDPVATDSVCCRIMGFNPKDVYYIRRLAEIGLGSMDNIKIVGESISSVYRPFKPPF
ncbi:MAG: DUF362 domain-containing protein [Candidatus Odinarchaeia archaeon]